MRHLESTKIHQKRQKWSILAIFWKMRHFEEFSTTVVCIQIPSTFFVLSISLFLREPFTIKVGCFSSMFSTIVEHKKIRKLKKGKKQQKNENWFRYKVFFFFSTLHNYLWLSFFHFRIFCKLHFSFFIIECNQVFCHIEFCVPFW